MIDTEKAPAATPLDALRAMDASARERAQHLAALTERDAEQRATIAWHEAMQRTAQGVIANLHHALEFQSEAARLQRQLEAERAAGPVSVAMEARS